MPVSFEALEQEARSRWDAESTRPWLRVGTALCGQAAGGLEVVEALQKELDSEGVDARLSEVGCFGLCYAEPLLDIQLPGGPRECFTEISTPSEPVRSSPHTSRVGSLCMSWSSAI